MATDHSRLLVVEAVERLRSETTSPALQAVQAAQAMTFQRSSLDHRSSRVAVAVAQELLVVLVAAA
jgi:hypothetical protein